METMAVVRTRSYRVAPAAGCQLGRGGIERVAVSGRYAYLSQNHRIQRLDLVTHQLEVLAGTGEPGMADGAAVTARFNCPRGLVVAGERLYVCDMGNHRLRVVNLATRSVATAAGTGDQGHVDGAAARGQVRADSTTVPQAVCMGCRSDGSGWRGAAPAVLSLGCRL